MYILDTSPLLDKRLANIGILSQSVLCLFILLTEFCNAKVFNFGVQLTNIFP